MPVTWVVAFTFLTGGLTAQHEALLRRTMRFRLLAVIDVLCLTVALDAGITAAVLLHGYWAPALQHLAFCVAYFFAVWIAVALRGGWVPMGPITALRIKERHAGGIRQLLRFGGNLTGFEVLNHMVRNCDNLLIGGFAGTTALGFYTRAYGLLLLPLRHPLRRRYLQVLRRSGYQSRGRYAAWRLGLEAQRALAVGRRLVDFRAR